MRETFYAILVILGVSVGFWHFRQAASVATLHSPLSVSKLSLAKGENKHEGISRKGRNRRHHAKAPSFRKDSGRSGYFAALEGIPAIFDEKAVGKVEGGEALSDGPSETAEIPAKRVHGIPVQAWLHSRNHTLPGQHPNSEEAAPVRFIVNCVELQNRPQWMTSSECQNVNEIKRLGAGVAVNPRSGWGPR